MTAASGASTLVELTLIGSVAITCVLSLRQSLRRWGGSGVVYAVWALVPLASLARLLPQFPTTAVEWLPVAALKVTAWAAIPVAPHRDVEATSIAMVLWLVGVALWSASALFRQGQLHGTLGRLRRFSGERDVWQTDRVDAGPLLVGMLRPRIVVPADFDERYSAVQQRLVLAHERVHRRRHDLWANMLVALLQAVFWFNPLFHYAAGRFRRDQELACDEAVLSMHPGSAVAYAEAILQTQLGAGRAPIACHWQRHHPLKERIMQLKSQRPGRTRRRFAKLFGVAIVTFGSVWTWAQDAVVPTTSGNLEHTFSKRESGEAKAGAYKVHLDFVRTGRGGIVSHRANLRFDDLMPGIGRELGGEHENLAGCTLKLTAQPHESGTVDVSMPITCPETGARRPRLRVKQGEKAVIEMGSEGPDGNYNYRVELTLS